MFQKVLPYNIHHFLASAKTSKEVKGILSQIDETLKLTKEIVPEKNISRSVVGDDIVEVTTKNGVIEMPTTKKEWGYIYSNI